MNKEHFMIELKLSLRDLSEDERQTVMEDYLEHFENGLLEGKTEEQIAKELGQPRQLAKEILANYGIESKVKSPEFSQGDWVAFENEKSTYEELYTKPRRHNTNSPLMTVFKFIGLAFFNLVVVLGPAIAIFSCVLAGLFIGGAFTLLPLVGIYTIITGFSVVALFQLSMSILFAGAGILLLAAMYPLSKLLCKLTKIYILWNVRTIFGGSYNEN
ncbi:DUF1700 domain-containing protein [Carnobacterium gallinarum]|uniref:DUF1700 domain-containing protein n=1 Tax=Carnobacterium gallinarum TaxID=2749 RepID=UPI00054F62D1|nr:DUF1700 domain-containing protein [Carnobacterium gallinarum]